MLHYPLLLLPLAAGQGVSVYPPVPGLPPSPYYTLRVREVGAEEWLEAATLLTDCTADKFCNTTGFYDHLNGWSNTYTNLVVEAGARVEVEVTTTWGGGTIQTATPHPAQAVEGCQVTFGFFISCFPTW